MAPNNEGAQGRPADPAGLPKAGKTPGASSGAARPWEPPRLEAAGSLKDLLGKTDDQPDGGAGQPQLKSL